MAKQNEVETNDSADDGKYLVMVVKKQLGLSDDEAEKRAKKIKHPTATKIVEAARTGDVATVRELLKIEETE